MQWASGVLRSAGGCIGLVGLAINGYFLLLPLLSWAEGYFVPDQSYLFRLLVALGSALIGGLLVIGSIRGWQIGILLTLVALLGLEYVVIHNRLLP